MKIKRLISVMLAIAALAVSLSGCKTKSYTAEIVVKNYGTITVKLDSKNAPITVKHFVELARAGLYDNTKFIRMQKEFVLQGGSGSSSTETIKGEFSSNGVSNNLKHKKGVLSMARANGNDTASTQFFIVLNDKSGGQLDGRYAAFGEITEGWEVVEKICADFTDDSFLEGYYGTGMGFLKESSYITIETIKITEG